ncbi:hypothetical protein MMC27_004964 [Xylographa pallens]|nr:hypothetical protein [Xylographa pallens]
MSGNFSLVEYLVNIGANVNAQNVTHKSCLHYAFEKSNLRIVRFLVRQGALIDHVDIYGRTVLHFLKRSTGSVMMGQRYMTADEWYTEAGSQFLDLLSALSFEGYAARDLTGETPLHFFVRAGGSKFFSRVLQLDASAHIEQSSQGGLVGSLLHYSAFGGSVPIMEKVLTDNPDIGINQQCCFGITPLHQAAGSSTTKLAMIEAILNHGADVNIRDRYGRDPLCFFVSNIYNRCSEQLIEAVSNVLLKHGGSLKATDCLGNTLLHYATRCGNIPHMKFLLKRGCDVNAGNVNNVTPLHYAEVRGGFWDPLHQWGREPKRKTEKLSKAVDLLLSWGADPLICGRFDSESSFLPAPVSGNWCAAITKDPSYAYLTPVGLARICPDAAYSATFNTSLHKYYPEICVDAVGDIFWDAREDSESCGQGSEFLVVKPKDAELGNDLIYNQIWNTRGFHKYDEN